MGSREELLQSIQPNMKLNKSFFLNIYADEITHPGFKDIAIKALNDAGCGKAEEYYNMVVSEYEKKHNEELKNVASWYLKKCQDDWERFKKKNERKGDKTREQKILQGLHQKSDRELLSLLQNIN